jgi:signal transduction histidine kinase
MTDSPSLSPLARLRVLATGDFESNGLPRLTVAAAVVLVVLTLFATAGTFSNAAALERLAVDASSLHRSNATAGTAGIARAALSQAIVFEADHQLGVSTEEDAVSALEEAQDALEGFTAVADPGLAEVGAFSAAAGQVVDALEEGAVATADRVRRDELEPAYTQLRDVLREHQVAAEQAIRETRTSAGRTAWISRILTTLAIPALAMTSYWWWTRRRVRGQQQEMQAWVEAERAVARAKDDLIAGISHELRTPLTSIHGFAEVLLESDFDESQARDLLGIIHSESGELARMIEDLLTAARIDAGQLQVSVERIDLEENVNTVVEPFVRRGHPIATSTPPVAILADPLRLRQILRNLVSNAIRHGGTNIAVLVEAGKDHARITVADDGPGVPAEIVDRLFHRFVNGGKGAVLQGSVGLGLSVARELAIRMGGDISYRRLDGITMFELDVPLATKRRLPFAAAS